VAEPDSVRGYGMGASPNLKLPEVEKAQEALNQMAASVKSLEKSLQNFGDQSYMIADKINKNLKKIGDTAVSVAGQLGQVAAATGLASGSGGGFGTGTTKVVAPSGSSGSGGGGTAQQWVSSASAAIQRVANKGLGAGLSLGSFIGTSGDDASTLLKDAALAPLRYMRQRINTNRDTAMMASGGLNMMGVQQGVQTDKLMELLSKFPGSIYGTPQDLIQMFAAAPAMGASFNFGKEAGTGGGGQGVRAAGFYKGIREMQMLNPMASVGGEGGLVSQLGGYAGDTAAQQRSMMLTGGAMSMIGAGGRQKSLSEWAESILRWFQGLRTGAKRNTPFNHGDLMAQYFPGSNIDAWFQANGVPQQMRDYWWTYALGKAGKNEGEFQIGPDENNVAWQRLRSSSELTRTEFSLAGKMSAQYSQREASNRWFNELMGSIQSTVIPALSNTVLGWVQLLPDSIEDLMMTVVERGAASIGDTGDVGDIGDSYGAVGGTGLSGLHPDMKKKVGAMMRANPNVRMTSGLRDTGLQERLKGKGYSNVSGKPSAHTRGMAADLGPSSQYGWISRNAKRFGLASGKGHGEPWHVGMPGDISGVGDMFDDFLNTVKGVGSSAEGMAGFITKILGFVTGGLGKLIGGVDQAKQPFAASPDDLYAKLSGASKKTVLGIPTGMDLLKGNFFGGGGGESDAPVKRVGPNGSQSSGIAAATALFNAGFVNRKDLETITAISWRESKWNPDARNPHTSDRGLMQINMGAHEATMHAMGYDEADLMDIQKNANIAYRLWASGGGNYSAFKQLWGFSEASPHSKPVAGKPGWDNNGDPLGRTQGSDAAGIVRDSGLPVIGDVDSHYMSTSAPAGVRGNVVFHNQFNLGVSGYGGGSNGGIDVRRTVTLIADHLETEMKRRLVRSA
jgi:Transglycosylase SLT domain